MQTYQQAGQRLQACQSAVGILVLQFPQLRVPFAIKDGICKTDEYTHSQTEKCKAADPHIPASLLLINCGKDVHEHIDRAIHDREVNRSNQNNPPPEKQHPRPLERLAKYLRGIHTVRCSTVYTFPVSRESRLVVLRSRTGPYVSRTRILATS